MLGWSISAGRKSSLIALSIGSYRLLCPVVTLWRKFHSFCSALTRPVYAVWGKCFTILPRAVTPWAQSFTCVVIQASRICGDPMCLPSVWSPVSCFRMVPVVASLAASPVTCAGRTYCDFASSGKTPREGPIYFSHFIMGLAALPLSVAEKLYAYQTCIGDENLRLSCSDRTDTLTL